jgi:hypothetical protein
MKKITISLSAIAFIAAVTIAAALPGPPIAPTPVAPGVIQFGWTASLSDTNPQDPLNYILQEGTVVSNYTSTTNLGTNLSCTISNLPNGVTLHWAVLAMDTNSGLISPATPDLATTSPAQPQPARNFAHTVIQQ